MAKKHKKKCSVSLILREMKKKIHQTIHLCTYGLGKIRHYLLFVEGVQNRNTEQLLQPLSDPAAHHLPKLNTHIASDLLNSLPGVYLVRSPPGHVHEINSLKLETSQTSIKVDQNHELTLKYLSSSKEMNELHGHVWMNFTNQTSAEGSQTHSMIPYTLHSTTGKADVP